MSTKEKYKALISTLLNAWGGKATVKSAKSVEINGTAHNPAAVVVETWTAADGLSWYRKYSDGWVEQGGLVTGKNTGQTITFSTAFSAVPSCVNFISVFNGATDGDSSGHWVRSRTTTGFVMATNWNNKVIDVYWSACGY